MGRDGIKGTIDLVDEIERKWARKYNAIYRRNVTVQNAQEKAENWDKTLENNVDVLELLGLKVKLESAWGGMSDDVKEIFKQLLDAFGKN